MAIKTLLVCLTTLDHADRLMRLAVSLAREHGAHLVGLHTVEALLVYPGIAMHVPGPAFAAFNDSQKREAAAIRAVFLQHTEAEDFQSEFRLVRAEAVSASERMVESARAADLIIMAQEDRDADRPDQRRAQVAVIRESGRPVIVVPPEGDGGPLGRKVTLGWSDTREAARAAHDMIPLLAPGAEICLLRVGSPPPDSLRDSDGIDMAEALARHGFDVTLEHRDPHGALTADVLCRCAFEKGSDLIVTGAFGHSRAYDFVIGAVTHLLLRDAQVPVLFSK